MAVESPLQRTGELGFIVPDGTARVLEELRDDPTAFVGCLYHPETAAEVIFATPEGAVCEPDARISPFCGQHIIEESLNPMIPLLDISGGYWSDRNGYEPLLDRAHLEDFDAVLADIFVDEEAEIKQAGRLRTIVRSLLHRTVAS